MRLSSLLAPLALVVTLSALAPRPAARPAAAADTVVLVVRHAEKAAESGDVPLSAAGEARAQALVAVAREAGVTGVITTQFQRTRQTAAPLAASLGIAPAVVPATAKVPDHARAIADTIRARYAGGTVLVVGHSNTVPAIVAALGGAPAPDLCDDQYDALFTVIVAPDGKARVVKARYGAPSVLSEKCGVMR